MPPKKQISLFHPKKKPIQRPKEVGPDGKLVDKFVPILPSSKAKPEEDEAALPDGPYTDYKLMSSALNGWKYDIMKLDTRNQIELSSWGPPIKLNRKELRREDDGTITNAPVAVDIMRGPDGKPVIGMDGRVVQIDHEGRPIHNTDGTPAKGKAPGAANGNANGGRKKFQKKTRQVFKVPDEVRALRREERYPWVLEDSTGNETWVGQLEDMSRADQYGVFMPAANETFQFVPVHRWYKFSKRLKHSMPTDTAAVELEYQKQQKRDPAAWLEKRTGQKPSESTLEMFRAQAEGRYVGLTDPGESRASNGRRLQTVQRSAELFGDDGDDEDPLAARRRREKEDGEDAGMDEMLYEDDVADDEEQGPADQDDEEAKEVEERLKREYIQANKAREGYVDADDEEVPQKISKSAKRMQRMIRQREGNDAYDSDEEENPYASSQDEESEEEELLPSQVPLTQPPPGQPPSQPTQPPKATTNGAPHDSRPGSPVSPTSPSLGGHSIVAQRATSPKAMKLKPSTSSGGGSRAGSPLASGGRAGSPSAPGGSRASSPVVNGQKPSNKRKATDDASPTSPTAANAPPRPKKRKSAPLEPLEDRQVIKWLQEHDKVTTRECIQHFTPYLKDEAVKSHFTQLVKEVAQLKGGQLVLKAQYRQPGAASPSAPAS
ncbi:hypothetical protein BD626DRAFT_449538 [Schizophyllum amplum]|uniref:Uncharacterized protein n=1 Tax=Schizophyllum amplum TaxID=97359 RepID=A0A550CS20_9AGAR|nr:hypothetical protein BD626DRAFT_449538 [Auriculariopsis ampla]